MKTKLNTLLNRVDTRLAACAAAAGASLVAPNLAEAVVIDSGIQNIGVPNNFGGIYINFVTGATGITGLVPGWDWNPYNSGTSLSFFWTGGAGGVAGGSAYSVLSPGATIGAGSTFIALTAASATANWQAGVTNGFLGVRFLNESTGVINYGYVEFTTSAATGFPAVINRWFYENNGGSITIPSGTSVPEGGSTLALLGLAFAGIAGTRRLVGTGEAKA